MKDGIGDGFTRADHQDVANQLFSCYAKVGDARALASVIGEDELSPIDKLYLKFGKEFETRFIGQDPHENRSILKTLDIGWEPVSYTHLNTFYILCGWMTETDAANFKKELETDDKTFCIVEDDHNNLLTPPPTKLRNPKLFRPFEMFIKMYGLPAYGEFDPTILIGITYSFLFGFMFGDVGQGLLLLLGGYLLYRVKKMDLAAVISCCGFFSAVFGFLFLSLIHICSPDNIQFLPHAPVRRKLTVRRTPLRFRYPFPAL